MASQSQTTLQYQAIAKGGPFTLASVPKPTPGPNEISIRLKAIALNPLDWKQLDFGLMVESWPVVLGIDGSGVVEAVGQGVSQFSAGDEVFSLFGLDDRASAFQEVAVVPEVMVAKKAKSLSWEEAASLPICYCTAAATIHAALKIPLPFLSSPPGAQPRSILVLGGSSGVGAAAIQILRLALPSSATILATSSPQHHAQICSLGATKPFDQKSPSLIADIKAASPGGKGVDMIVDAVAGGAARPDIYATLRDDGPKEVGEVSTGASIEVPEGVSRTVAFGRQILKSEGGEGAMKALGKLVEEGSYKVPVRVEVVGRGLEAIAGGLEKLRSGTSGTKLVVVV